MKNPMISAIFAIYSTYGLAASIDQQDACLETAATTLAQAQVEAETALKKASTTCNAMSHVDVKNSCINEALAAYERSMHQANTVYDADVESCL